MWLTSELIKQNNVKTKCETLGRGAHGISERGSYSRPPPPMSTPAYEGAKRCQNIIFLPFKSFIKYSLRLNCARQNLYKRSWSLWEISNKRAVGMEVAMERRIVSCGSRGPIQLRHGWLTDCATSSVMFNLRMSDILSENAPTLAVSFTLLQIILYLSVTLPPEDTVHDEAILRW